MVDEAWLDRVSPIPPLPGGLPRVLHRRQLAELGLTRRAAEHRLARGRWRILLPQVYLTVDTPTEADRWAAALLFAGDGGALSGAAALRASDVRRVPAPDRILVLVPPPNRMHSAGFVQVRRTFRPIELLQWHGPRRVVVARALADHALTLRRLDDVRAAVGQVVQHGHCTVDEIGAELAAGPRNGSGNLRRALEEVGWGAESAPEAAALRLLRRAGITGFVPNAWIRLADGSWRRVDCYWPHLRFSLEMDGKQYHFDADHWTAGLDRDVELGKVGVYGIHRPPSALADPRRFIADVQALLAAREADLRLGVGDHVADSHTPVWRRAS